MELFWKATGAVLIGLVLTLTIGKKDISVVLTMAVCCLAAVAAASFLRPVMELIWELASVGDVQEEILRVLLKAVGIAVVSEIAGVLCADGGSGSMGKMLHLLGSAAIIWLSIPVFRSLLTMIREILGQV